MSIYSFMITFWRFEQSKTHQSFLEASYFWSISDALTLSRARGVPSCCKNAWRGNQSEWWYHWVQSVWSGPLHCEYHDSYKSNWSTPRDLQDSQNVCSWQYSQHTKNLVNTDTPNHGLAKPQVHIAVKRSNERKWCRSTYGQRGQFWWLLGGRQTTSSGKVHNAGRGQQRNTNTKHVYTNTKFILQQKHQKHAGYGWWLPSITSFENDSKNTRTSLEFGCVLCTISGESHNKTIGIFEC